jgi:hypothetical protein
MPVGLIYCLNYFSHSLQEVCIFELFNRIVVLIRFSEVVIILFYVLIGLNCIYVSTPVGPIYCPNYFLLNLQEVCM